MNDRLLTHTEQRREERLQARIADLEASLETIANAYIDALEALAQASAWRWHAVLAALAGGFIAILTLRGLS